MDHIFIILVAFLSLFIGASNSNELLRGFTASPNSTESSLFQSFLTDSSGNYSFGILCVNKTQLTLAVIHVSSSETIWEAQMNKLARWGSSTQIFFNGSLVVFDHDIGGGVLWSTYTNGDLVFLSSSSNLQVQKFDNPNSPRWQSFDIPGNTLVENQNFTSNMSLASSNGLYFMQLGSDFMALYGMFQPGSIPGQIYWKHKALEAKANIIPGLPIYLVLKSDGYLGMYQNGSVPVDVQSFNSFQQPISGVRRVRLESDGNLKGYFWTGSNWIIDYQAISNLCELPSACGPYGLCEPGKSYCSCLDNQTDYNISGGCFLPDNQDSGDFCNVENKNIKILETRGVDLPYKKLTSYEIMGSFSQCQNACQYKCTCWGVVYSNTSRYCYMLEYPIQTLVKVGDLSKLGYFKMRAGAGKKGEVMNVGLEIGVSILCLVVLVIGVGLGVWWHRRFRKRKRGIKGNFNNDGEIAIGNYKDLDEETSIRSIDYLSTTDVR